MSEKSTNEPRDALPPAPPDARRPYQFTLRWLFGVTTVGALFLSICASIGWPEMGLLALVGLGWVIGLTILVGFAATCYATIIVALQFIEAVRRWVFGKPVAQSYDENLPQAQDSP